MDRSRRVLEAVIAGTLSPSDGARRLMRLNSYSKASELRDDLPPVRVVRLTQLAGDNFIVGDSSVVEAIVEGPHAARRNGDALDIQPPGAGSRSHFQFDGAPASRRRHDSPHGALIVRMNPDLALEISGAAGRFNVHGVRGPIAADLLAGRLQLHDFVNCVQISLGSGVLDVEGIVGSGRSTLRCEAGLLRLHLRSGSNVRVVATAKLSSLTLPDDQASEARPWKPYTTRELTLGQGLGLVTVSSGIGHLTVSADP